MVNSVDRTSIPSALLRHNHPRMIYARHTAVVSQWKRAPNTMATTGGRSRVYGAYTAAVCSTLSLVSGGSRLFPLLSCSRGALLQTGAGSVQASCGSDRGPCVAVPGDGTSGSRHRASREAPPCSASSDTIINNPLVCEATAPTWAVSGSKRGPVAKRLP